MASRLQVLESHIQAAPAVTQTSAAPMRTILVATEKPFAAAAVKALEKVISTAPGFRLKMLEKYTSRDQLLKAVEDADALIVRSDLAHRDVFQSAKKLQIVVRAGAGVDNIDLTAATEHEVVAMNTPGQNANAVAELAFGMMLYSCRNAFDGSSGVELRGKTIGLFGCGAVARRVIALAGGFGMKCVAYDPFLSKEQIAATGAAAVATPDELFDCDYVSLHIPATKDTKKSISTKWLSRMPKGAALINTARKEVIDEAALLSMMKERPDLRYLSDVITDNQVALRDTLGKNFKKQVLFTPKKMGAQTKEANTNAAIAAARQIVAYFAEGDVTFQVNKQFVKKFTEKTGKKALAQ